MITLKFIYICLYFSGIPTGKCNSMVSDKVIFHQKDTSRPILYLLADKLPEYPEGNSRIKQFLARNLHWPAEDLSFNGTLLMSFIVEPDGSLSNVKVETNSCPPCNRECIKAMQKMPKWKPGELNHKPIRTLMYLPIDFTIRE